VDDPYLFGQIGAANSLSDIYAMGGKPLTCLNLVGFPSKDLGPEVLHGIVEGALSKITEAGAVLAGGHTTDDDEPKFGLSVTGVVHPQKYWRNAGARVGDVLILTKPVGSGVIFNANLKKWVSDGALAECLQIITTLNKTAAEILAGFEVHAATDITGFGLAGHALEMAQGSDVVVEIDTSAVPIMREALEMYEKGVSTGVNAANRALIEEFVRFEKELPVWHREIFVDPQTSGGLLVSVPEAQGEEVLRALRDGGVEKAQQIGCVKPRPQKEYLLFT
jgi:selenide,water dikinase